MPDLVFLLSAEIDIQSAYEFYEQYQDARGDLFLRHLETAFTHLRTFPESAPLIHGIYRRLLVPRFPYGIFYAVESRIIVAAVRYLGQDPEQIVRRLGGPQT